MAEDSILEKYDTVIAQYFVDYYAALYPTLAPQVLVATPDRQFADFTTKQFVDNRLLEIPRIQVYRGGFMTDARRHNPNVMRKLLVDSDCRSYRQVHFPCPANVSYQIGFWTDKVHQANRWIERSQLHFCSGYRYFTVTVGDGWGDKLFPLFLERIDNNSDLEPDEGPRAIRYDLTFRLEGWVFDQPGIDPTAGAQPGVQVPAVFEVETTVCELDTSEELLKTFDPEGGL